MKYVIKYYFFQSSRYVQSFSELVEFEDEHDVIETANRFVDTCLIVEAIMILSSLATLICHV